MSYLTSTPSTRVTVPFRTIRNAQGIVTIEKHFHGGGTNCGLVLLLITIGILIPASLVAVAPIASILLFFGSTFFPGIPMYLVNKRWSIEIDNYNRILKITRWHDFNKQLRKVTPVTFDEIREIVAETSVDGTKRRLVLVTLQGTRHVLYESMDIAHSDAFKNLFMATIQLQGVGGAAGSFPSATQSTASPSLSPSTSSSMPGTGRGGGDSLPDTTVVVPSLRQFAIPDPALTPAEDLVPRVPVPASAFPAASRYSGSVGDHDLLDVQGKNGSAASASSPATWVPGGHEGDALSREDPVETSKRLESIARKKREALSRIYQPGTEPAPENVPGPEIVNPIARADQDGVEVHANACSPMKNIEDRYNEFIGCDALAYIFSPELGGRPAAIMTGVTETRAGRAPKKKAGDKDGKDDEDEVIERKIDRKTERELSVEKVRPRCMVCAIPLKGTTYICPTCDTKYCIRCARTLASRKEYCWNCRKPMKGQ